MTKTIVIGDCHLKNIPYQPDYIKAQCQAIKDIVTRECFAKDGPHDRVVFLGDVFHSRKPTPTELLEFKYLLEDVEAFSNDVYIVRGNHESETKADDGVTCLSLFSSPNVHVFEHVGAVRVAPGIVYHFIPHYENQKFIENALAEVQAGSIIFGHFGFDGATNSAGDRDFSIKRSSFNNATFLGHIHHYREEGKITIVGTPYTTSFQESGKKNFYGVIHHTDKSWSFSRKEVTWGPKHVVADYDELGTEEWNILFEEKWTDCYVLLRVLMNELNATADSKVRQQIKERFGVKYVDIKFHPVHEQKEEAQSGYAPTEAVFQITDDLIEEYVDKNNTELPKEDILQGLQDLKK